MASSPLRERKLAIALLALVVLAGVVAYLVAGRDAGGGGEDARITVYAASSLTDALPAVDPSPRYSFAGSNALAAQIESGAPADVFASADPELVDDLHARGLVGPPVRFASNLLVVVVPASNPADIRTVADLAKPGVSVVVAGPDVPVGGYTLDALRILGLEDEVLRNVVSRETDVRGVLTKVAVGQADAGFVYSSDAQSASDQVTAIPVPQRAQPRIEYAIAVVSRTRHPEEAQAYVDRVLSQEGQEQIVAYGFVPVVPLDPGADGRG